MFARKLAPLLGEPGRARSQLSSSSTVIAAIGRLSKYRENAASRNFKSVEPTLTSCLSLVHLRTLATQDDHFRCGFSCVITALLFCIRRGKTPQLYLFTVSPLCMRL